MTRRKAKTDRNQAEPQRITFWVDGNPIPKQSYRHSSKGGYTDPRVKAWQKAVAWEAAKHRPVNLITGPVKADLVFVRSDRRRVDSDNLSKAVLDALNGIIWEDDKQVCNLHIIKGYDKYEPGVRVTVEDLDYEWNSVG